MKKIIFGIFAHPDDEAFGPAGTLLKEVKDGNDVHLIMLTAGDAGMNPDGVLDLSIVRLEEWHEAAKLLGAASTHFLGYKDGQLNNRSMIAVAEQVESIVAETLHAAPKDALVEFIAFDFSGLSGHIDHIVATRAACLAFYRLKKRDERLSRLRLFCLSSERYPDSNVDWLYMESGRSKSEIDETIDAREYREEILAIMHAHKSQAYDCERYLKSNGEYLGLNHFMVKT